PCGGRSAATRRRGERRALVLDGVMGRDRRRRRGLVHVASCHIRGLFVVAFHGCDLRASEAARGGLGRARTLCPLSPDRQGVFILLYIKHAKLYVRTLIE